MRAAQTVRIAARWPAWPPPASLRLRLTTWYTAVLAATMLLFGLGLYLLLAHTLNQGSYQVAVDVAQGLAGTVQVRAAPPRGPLRVVLPPTNVFGAPATFVQVADTRTGEVVARSVTLGAQTLPFLAQAVAAARRRQPTVHTVGAIYRLHLYSTPLVNRGRVVGVIQVGNSLAGAEQLLDRLRLLLLVGLALALPTAAAFGWTLAGRALAPIEDFARTAGEIGHARDFSRRVAHHGPRDEVGHLASTMNVMLAELEDAHLRLEKTLAAQQRFVADASHELRTPLTIIRSNAEMLQWTDAGDAPQRTEALADLTSEAARMGALVNDLLTLARADASPHLALCPTPLRPLVEEAGRQAQLLTSGQKVALDETEPSTEVTAAIDPDAFTQLLRILLDNALKYTASGGCVALALTCSPAGGEALVTVSDTGRGIAAADLPHIFERFYRADDARDREGSGLGLSIARLIAGQHGGRIDVASTLGQGSVFTVRLPASAPD